MGLKRGLKKIEHGLSVKDIRLNDILGGFGIF
jgi:hypothetical protein